MGRPRKNPLKKLSPKVLVEKFLDCATWDDAPEDAKESSAHLYAAFKQWCSKRGFVCLAPSVFGRALGKALEDNPVKSNGGQSYWMGVQLHREWKEIALKDEDRRKPKERWELAADLNAMRPKNLDPSALMQKFFRLAVEFDFHGIELNEHLFVAHTLFCEWSHYSPLSKSLFWRHINHEKFKIVETQVTVDGCRRRARRGLRLNTGYKEAVLGKIAREQGRRVEND